VASQSGTVSREQVQTILSHLLLEKVRQDTHPSETYMTMLEQTLPPSLHREYLNILLEKVMNDGRPSTTMIRRIQRFADQL
jgi:hypothetical protein